MTEEGTGQIRAEWVDELPSGTRVIIRVAGSGERWGTLLGFKYERNDEQWAIVGLATGEVARLPMREVVVPGGGP